MKNIGKEYWFVVVAGILAGSIVFGGKLLANLGLSLYEISVLPFIFPTIIFLPLIIFKKECRFKKGMVRLLCFYGLTALIVTVAQFGAVILGVSVAITVLLLYTQPLWTILFTTFFLKEKVIRREVIACLIVFLGIFILADPTQTGVIRNWIGILMALIGGVSLSGWVILGSLLSKKGNNPINSLFAGNLFMIILLLIAYPFLAGKIGDASLIRFSLTFTPTVWFYIILFGVTAGMIVQLFYLYGVKKVPTVDAGIILLLEPIVGALLAAIFLGQLITINIFIGGLLILFANYLILTKR